MEPGPAAARTYAAGRGLTGPLYSSFPHIFFLLSFFCFLFFFLLFLFALLLFLLIFFFPWLYSKSQHICFHWRQHSQHSTEHMMIHACGRTRNPGNQAARTCLQPSDQTSSHFVSFICPMLRETHSASAPLHPPSTTLNM